MSGFEEPPKDPPANDSSGHGRGDRSSYYGKWDNFANKAAADIEDEEKQVKKERDEHLSKTPSCEAEKRDLEKRKELKEAKKVWDGVSLNEEAMKIVVGNQISQEHKVLCQENDLDSKRVLVLKNNSDCSYELPEGMDMIKLFIEDCKNCVVTVHCKFATSTIEMSRCEGISLKVIKHPIHTVQVDISDNIHLMYSPSVFHECKVFHSKVRNLRVEYDWMNNLADTKYQILDGFELSRLSVESGASATEHCQFVTTFLNNDLVTDLVLRDAGGHTTTMREIEERKAKIVAAVQEKGVDINSEHVQSFLQEYDPPSTLQLATLKKDKGNGFFKTCEYGQAAVHYTEAIETVKMACLESDDVGKSILCASYSNRAACSLKLGDHNNAIADCDACILLDPKHVKCNFRKGLALHALERYREACPVLGRALALEPNNAQIKSALQFAERKAAKM